MHKTLPRRLLAGAFSFSLVGLALSPLAAPAALATKAASVSAGASELRVDTGSTAGAFSNPYFGANVTADSHGHVFAAYTDVRDGGTSVYVNRSSDYGGSYAAADVRVDRTSGAGTANAIGASVATDGAGTVYVLWPDTREAGALKMFMAVSRDYGATFGTAARVGSSSQLVVISGGGLFADHKGDVYVAWTDERTTAAKTDLYFQRSSDYGATWQASDLLLDNGTTVGTVDSDNLHLAADGSGRVVVVYDDARNGSRDIFTRASADYGATFGAEVRIDTATGPGGAGDAAPVIATDGRGNFVAAWKTNTLSPIDIAASRSIDGGATWSTPTKVNTGTNIGAGATVGQVVVDPSGVVLVSYQNIRAVVGMANVYVNRSTDFGASFAATDSRLDLGRTEGSATADLATPVMSLDKFGNVVVAYADDRTAAGDFNVYTNTSEDLGVTWQATDTRVSTGSGAGFDSNDARVVTDNRARATVLYRSDRTTGGTFDVYARPMTFTLVDKDLVRDGGSDRYATAAVVSTAQFPAKYAHCIVVASGEGFPDALAGVPLAAQCQGPLLLTKKASLPSATSTEILRVMDGAAKPKTTVYVLGGSAAVSTSVVTAIGALSSNLTTKVLSGADREHTALAVAAEEDTLRGKGPSHVWVTRKDSFSDALVVGVIAGSRSVDTDIEPVLLTSSTSLSADLASYLASKNATLTTAFVAGGTSAISSAVFNNIDTIVTTVTRYGGTNRYDTGKIADTAFFGGARAPLEVAVASGTSFADPLSGGPVAAANDRPIVLTKKDTLPTESTSYVTSVATTLAGGRVLGGLAAVSDAVKNYVQSLY